MTDRPEYLSELTERLRQYSPLDQAPNIAADILDAHDKLRATCPTCGGSGHPPRMEFESLKRCPNCDGSGRLSVEATIKRLVNLVDELSEALKDRRRTVLVRGGGISRRHANDATADTLLREAHAVLASLPKDAG